MSPDTTEKQFSQTNRPFLPKGQTDLLCYDGLAVDFYSFTLRASHIGL